MAKLEGQGLSHGGLLGNAQRHDENVSIILQKWNALQVCFLTKIITADVCWVCLGPQVAEYIKRGKGTKAFPKLQEMHR